MNNERRTRVLILGGGFGGLYAALEFERELRERMDLQVTLVNRENFFLFTPLLHEVAASDLDLTHIVSPVRKLLSRVQFFEGEVESIDLATRRVVVSHGLDRHTHDLDYDHLILGLGSVTNFFGLPGVEQHALTMKSLADAVYLRNRLIGHLEEADSECAGTGRNPLLTVAVAGGGFAGVETLAAINDFLREALRYYPNLRPEHLRLVLVHPGKTVLPELGPELGAYAQERLQERGIEILGENRVHSFDGETVTLAGGARISTRLLVWTAGTCAHPLLAALPAMTERGRLRVDEFLEVPDWPGVWALGDSASVPDGATGKACPPTAQHALRQGTVVARNVLATLRGAPRRPFRFAGLGQLASIGHRTGVARVFGVNFSGFLAWWLWRTVYLVKLPRFEKKLRVALDWTLDVLFSKDLVQFTSVRPPVAAKPLPIESQASVEAVR